MKIIIILLLFISVLFSKTVKIDKNAGAADFAYLIEITNSNEFNYFFSIIMVFAIPTLVFKYIIFMIREHTNFRVKK